MAFASFPHKIEYPDNKGITLLDVAETLFAHDRIVRLLPQVLEKCVPGLKIEKIEISLLQAEEGSLLEEFAVKLWSTYQTDIQKEVIGLVEAMTGSKVPPEHQTVITLLILALIFYGAAWLYKKVNPTAEGNRIRGDYNTIVNITANQLSVSPDRLDTIINDTARGPFKRTLVKAAQQFFKPAQRNGSGRIKVEGYGEISKETVGAVPTDAETEATLIPFGSATSLAISPKM